MEKPMPFHVFRAIEGCALLVGYLVYLFLRRPTRRS
jgi:hypothetical protein